MGNRSISDRVALGSIRPKNAQDRRSLVKLSAVFVGIVILVSLLLYLKIIDKERRNDTWRSANARIEDARPKLTGENQSQSGGAMLYQVEVLIRYQTDTGNEERWVVIAERSMLHSDAEFQAARWKGAICTVRWKPSDPNALIVEAS